MPKSLEEILAHADELSRRAEETEPDWTAAEITPLGEVYRAVQARAKAEAALATSVRRAHKEGSSWRELGAALGTSASAARQRYGAARPAKSAARRFAQGFGIEPVPAAATVARTSARKAARKAVAGTDGTPAARAAKKTTKHTGVRAAKKTTRHMGEVMQPARKAAAAVARTPNKSTGAAAAPTKKSNVER